MFLYTTHINIQKNCEDGKKRIIIFTKPHNMALKYHIYYLRIHVVKYSGNYQTNCRSSIYTDHKDYNSFI
jgi:hypothetical protein